MPTKNISNNILVLILGICLFFIVSEKWIGGNGERWKMIVDSDGRGYYAYLPAIFIYHNLNFDFSLRAESEVYGKGMADYPHLMNGQRGNKYFIGEALLITPFFLLAWLISFLSGFSLTGYNMIFFESVSIAALFYLLLGLVFIMKLLRLYKIRESWIQVIIIMLVFGTNVFHYAVYEPSMSHIYSFAAVAFFLFYLKKYHLEKKSLFLYLSAVGLGLIILIRPINGIIILAAPFLLGSYDEFKKFINSLFSQKKLVLKSMLIFSSIIFIQALILYLTYGSFIYWPYRGEGFDFLHPHFIDVLFSYRKGLFIYTPFIFLSILYIIPYFKKSIFASLSFIVFFLILDYILSSWSSWFYGGSFSLRAFLEFYPLFIIPFAIGINEIKKKQIKILTSVVLFAILTVSVIQTYQYENNILHFVNMDKEKYWKVFLHTNHKYKLVSFPVNADTSDVRGIVLKKIFLNDFEGSIDWGFGNTITTDQHYSGNHSSRLQIPNSYSPSFVMTGKEINGDSVSYLKIHLFSKSPQKSDAGLLIVSIEGENNKISTYNTYPLNPGGELSADWVPVKYGLDFPMMKDKDVMKIYVWNDSNDPVYIDDFKIELYSEK